MAAEDTFNTIGNIYNARQNMKVLTPKGFVKNTAKAAGQGIIEENHASLQQQADYVVPDFQAGPSTNIKANDPSCRRANKRKERKKRNTKM